MLKILSYKYAQTMLRFDADQALKQLFTLLKMHRLLEEQLICIICPPLVLCSSLHTMFVLMFTTSRPGVERLMLQW